MASLTSYFAVPMAASPTPHFQNDMGLSKIEIGAREFMCIGAKPPFDHPHVFLNMGGAEDIVCPYCSTLSGTTPNQGGRTRPEAAVGRRRAA